ncbi:MAG TPA: hypothetical protein VMV72_19935 [Verrucomicrobiae bacterium]|nr:hypothetical protein [Verrucomicrobiae bacterium]
MKRVVMSVMVVLALGCHTPSKKQREQMAAEQQLKREEAVRRLLYLEANPDLSPEVRNAIARGQVLQGMTESDVRASIGEPDEIASTPTKTGSREQWDYTAGPHGKEHLDFEDDTLTGWRPVP